MVGARVIHATGACCGVVGECSDATELVVVEGETEEEGGRNNARLRQVQGRSHARADGECSLGRVSSVNEGPNGSGSECEEKWSWSPTRCERRIVLNAGTAYLQRAPTPPSNPAWDSAVEVEEVAGSCSTRYAASCKSRHRPLSAMHFPPLIAPRRRGCSKCLHEG